MKKIIINKEDMIIINGNLSVDISQGRTIPLSIKDIKTMKQIIKKTTISFLFDIFNPQILNIDNLQELHLLVRSEIRTHS